MKNDRSVIENLAKSLESNKLIEIEMRKSKIEFLSLSERSLLREKNDLRNNANLEINDDDLDYINFSGISYCWSYTNESNEFIYGGFNINGFFEALLTESNFWDVFNSINEYEPSDQELIELKKLNWIDRQPWGDDGKFTCFFREKGVFPNRLFYYDYGMIFPMNISFYEYFIKMAKCYAIKDWQYFYVDFPKIFGNFKKNNKEKIFESIKFSYKMLNKLFIDNKDNEINERMIKINEILS